MDPRISTLSTEKQKLLLQRLRKLSHHDAQNKLVMQTSPAPHLTIDRRPLLSLFAAGEIGPVDAIAVGCLSDHLLKSNSALLEQDLTHRMCHNLPVFANVRTLPMGRIASVILPRFYSQIYLDRSDVVRLVTQCRKLGKTLGAKVISLTGLIPSATDYGRAIPVDEALPQVTTGHATTTSAVVLSIKQLLAMSHRRLEDETVAVVGIGSIGSSSLRLMLSVLPHPRRLILCDVYQKRDFVQSLMTEIRDELGYAGELSFHHEIRGVAAEAYQARVILGATNVPNVLDVKRLEPGSLIVDDSDPHCFDPDAAIERLESQADILFSEGGFLSAPQAVEHLAYVPEEFAEQLPVETHFDTDRRITGCVLSGLLSAREGYPITVGDVRLDDARVHFRRLLDAGFTAASPHCGTYTISSDRIQLFADRFGTRVTTQTV